MQRILIIGILAGVVIGGYLLIAPRDAKAPTELDTTAPFSVSRLEVADDPDERAQGLGGRTEIPDDYGMLFIFEIADTYGFWMKDMKAPIDIIWLSDNGTIVGIEANVMPESFPETFQPAAPVRYVLETRANLAKERGWHEGLRLALPLE